MEKSVKKKQIPVLQLRCGECSGLNRDRLVDEKNTCSASGKVESSRACPAFKSDVFSLQEMVESEGALIALSKLVAKLPDSGLKKLAAVIYKETNTRKHKYRFGQVVFVRYRGTVKANYFSNFMMARVMDADKTTIRLMSNDGKCILTFERSSGPNGPSIYTRENFKILREEMIQNEHYVDPEHERTEKRLKAREQYDLIMSDASKNGDIVTIDTVFEESGVSKRSTNDLVSIVRDLQSGFNVSGKYYRRRKDDGTPVRLRARKKSGDVEMEV